MGSRLEANSTNVRKRIENHTFHDEDGEEYGASKFGGFVDYMRRKKIKLQNLDSELRAASSGDPLIFRGIVAHVNGYTQPSLNDLHHLIVGHGGGFLQYLDGKTAVTHVIASSLTLKKRVEFARYRIVKPAWVVESVKAGRLLPWDSFRVLDEGVRQKVLGFDNGQVVSQRNSLRGGYRDQTDTSWYTSQIKNTARETDRDDQNQDHDQSQDHETEDQERCDPTTTQLDPEGLLEEDHSPQVAAASRSPSGESLSLTHRDPTVATSEFGGSSARTIQESSHDQVFERIPSEKAIDREGMATEAEAVRLESHHYGSSRSPEALAETSAVRKPGPDPAVSRSPEKHQLTAEEHNAKLLSDPHLAKSSTANPDFLNQYYRESRLHHLSTWKADLKAQLQARAEEKSSSQRIKRTPGARRYIMHIDFDSFFAAVSLRNNPQLVDKPVVVAHGSGPGSEIASCNYPARKFGIKNGMWMKFALQQCPDLKVLPYDFKAYEEASRHFYEAILATDGIVQSVSIDEALVDISRQCIEAGGSDGKVVQEGLIFREQARACSVAENLRVWIKEKTGCAVSIGIGSNILLAKVALRKAKPAGQYLIKPEEVLGFIGELTVTDLPGVAYSLGGKLEEMGVKLVKDIRALTKERLVTTLGPKTGEKLWDYSRGIDNAEVGEQAIRKSVSAEVNWGIRFVTQQQADEFVQCLCDELSRRLLEQTVKGKQLTMKIMRRAADAPRDPPKNLGHGKCDTFNKSILLGVATNDKAMIGREALSILRGYGFSPGELRGLGVQMTKLEPLKPPKQSSSSSSSSSSSLDSSQRRLQFKKPATSPSAPTPLGEDPSSHRSRPHNDGASSLSLVGKKLSEEPDAIEEIPTPVKSEMDNTVVSNIDRDDDHAEDPKHTLLNISGTQFILPTQLDTTVLAELPADIRSKFAPKENPLTNGSLRPAAQLSRDQVSSGSAIAFPSDLEYGLPDQGDLDPEIVNALPEDVRSELRAHYRADTTRSKHGMKGQMLFPQSPWKQKTAAPSSRITPTPAKKHKGLAVIHKGKAKAKGMPTTTLTQSNFVAVRGAKHDSNDESAADAVDDEISESFLAELPAEIRAEILAEQKRNRRRAKFGLDVGTNRRKPRAHEPAADETGFKGQRRLDLPLPPPKATFTSRRLSTLPELREAMNAWVEEFSGDNEEGPFDEDVAALASYLEKVILDDRDLEKAVSVVDWLSFVINDKDLPEGPLRTSWFDALDRLREDVQRASARRNMPPVAFGTN